MPNVAPPVPPDMSLASKFEAELRRLILDPLHRAIVGRVNRAGKDYHKIRKAIRKARPNLPTATVNKLAIQYYAQVKAYHTQQFEKSMRRHLGTDVDFMSDKALEPVMKDRLRENVDLIKTIPGRHLGPLYKDITKLAKQAPFDQQKLQKILSNRYNSSGYNLRRITRDQTVKAIGDLNETRQRQVGVTHYKWHTARDERVRPSHWAKEGRVFSWKSPPADTGHPGDDINCRCTASPVITRQLRIPRDQLRKSTQPGAPRAEPFSTDKTVKQKFLKATGHGMLRLLGYWKGPRTKMSDVGLGLLNLRKAEKVAPIDVATGLIGVEARREKVTARQLTAGILGLREDRRFGGQLIPALFGLEKGAKRITREDLLATLLNRRNVLAEPFVPKKSVTRTDLWLSLLGYRRIGRSVKAKRARAKAAAKNLNKHGRAPVTPKEMLLSIVGMNLEELERKDLLLSLFGARRIVRDLDSKNPVKAKAARKKLKKIRFAKLSGGIGLIKAKRDLYIDAIISMMDKEERMKPITRKEWVVGMMLLKPRLPKEWAQTIKQLEFASKKREEALAQIATDMARERDYWKSLESAAEVDREGFLENIFEYNIMELERRLEEQEKLGEGQSLYMAQMNAIMDDIRASGESRRLATEVIEQYEEYKKRGGVTYKEYMEFRDAVFGGLTEEQVNRLTGLRPVYAPPLPEGRGGLRATKFEEHYQEIESLRNRLLTDLELKPKYEEEKADVYSGEVDPVPKEDEEEIPDYYRQVAEMLVETGVSFDDFISSAAIRGVEGFGGVFGEGEKGLDDEDEEIGERLQRAKAIIERLMEEEIAYREQREEGGVEEKEEVETVYEDDKTDIVINSLEQLLQDVSGSDEDRQAVAEIVSDLRRWVKIDSALDEVIVEMGRANQEVASRHHLYNYRVRRMMEARNLDFSKHDTPDSEARGEVETSPTVDDKTEHQREEQGENIINDATYSNDDLVQGSETTPYGEGTQISQEELMLNVGGGDGDPRQAIEGVRAALHDLDEAVVYQQQIAEQFAHAKGIRQNRELLENLLGSYIENAKQARDANAPDYVDSSRFALREIRLMWAGQRMPDDVEIPTNLKGLENAALKMREENERYLNEIGKGLAEADANVKPTREEAKTFGIMDRAWDALFGPGDYSRELQEFAGGRWDLKDPREFREAMKEMGTRPAEANVLEHTFLDKDLRMPRQGAREGVAWWPPRPTEELLRDPLYKLQKNITREKTEQFLHMAKDPEVKQRLMIQLLEDDPLLKANKRKIANYHEAVSRGIVPNPVEVVQMYAETSYFRQTENKEISINSLQNLIDRYKSLGYKDLDKDPKIQQILEDKRSYYEKQVTPPWEEGGEFHNELSQMLAVYNIDPQLGVGTREDIRHNDAALLEGKLQKLKEIPEPEPLSLNQQVNLLRFRNKEKVEEAIEKANANKKRLEEEDENIKKERTTIVNKWLSKEGDEPFSDDEKSQLFGELEGLEKRSRRWKRGVLEHDRTVNNFRSENWNLEVPDLDLTQDDLSEGRPTDVVNTQVNAIDFQRLIEKQAAKALSEVKTSAPVQQTVEAIQETLKQAPPAEEEPEEEPGISSWERLSEISRRIRRRQIEPDTFSWRRLFEERTIGKTEGRTKESQIYINKAKEILRKEKAGSIETDSDKKRLDIVKRWRENVLDNAINEQRSRDTDEIGFEESNNPALGLMLLDKQERGEELTEKEEALLANIQISIGQRAVRQRWGTRMWSPVTVYDPSLTRREPPSWALSTGGKEPLPGRTWYIPSYFAAEPVEAYGHTVGYELVRHPEHAPSQDPMPSGSPYDFIGPVPQSEHEFKEQRWAGKYRLRTPQDHETFFGQLTEQYRTRFDRTKEIETVHNWIRNLDKTIETYEDDLDKLPEPETEARFDPYQGARSHTKNEIVRIRIIQNTAIEHLMRHLYNPESTDQDLENFRELMADYERTGRVSWKKPVDIGQPWGTDR